MGIWATITCGCGEPDVSNIGTSKTSKKDGNELHEVILKGDDFEKIEKNIKDFRKKVKCPHKDIYLVNEKLCGFGSNYLETTVMFLDNLKVNGVEPILLFLKLVGRRPIDISCKHCEIVAKTIESLLKVDLLKFATEIQNLHKKEIIEAHGEDVLRDMELMSPREMVKQIKQELSQLLRILKVAIRNKRPLNIN